MPPLLTLLTTSRQPALLPCRCAALMLPACDFCVLVLTHNVVLLECYLVSAFQWSTWWNVGASLEVDVCRTMRGFDQRCSIVARCSLTRYLLVVCRRRLGCSMCLRQQLRTQRLRWRARARCWSSARCARWLASQPSPSLCRCSATCWLATATRCALVLSKLVSLVGFCVLAEIDCCLSRT